MSNRMWYTGSVGVAGSDDHFSEWSLAGIGIPSGNVKPRAEPQCAISAMPLQFNDESERNFR